MTEHFANPDLPNDAANSPAKSWYAAYTCAHHEKRVAEQLGARAVEHFLPLYPSVRRWKDRRVELDMPLFPSYVFVHLGLGERMRVLEVPSVARLVGFNGVPTPLPDIEIETLRRCLQGGLRAEPHPYLKVGRRVRIISGPLQDLEGRVARRKSALRFVVSLDLIQRSILLQIDSSSLEALT